MNREETLERFCYVGRLIDSLRDRRPCPLGWYSMSKEETEELYKSWYNNIEPEVKEQYDKLTAELEPLWEEQEKLKKEILAW